MRSTGEELRRRGRRRVAVTVAACLCTALIAPAGALASNHLVKLREVYAGSVAHPGDEYVEVQMYAPGETFFENQVTVRLYNAAGMQTSSFKPMTGDGNPPHGENQRRVLFATQ